MDVSSAAFIIVGSMLLVVALMAALALAWPGSVWGRLVSGTGTFAQLHPHQRRRVLQYYALGYGAWGACSLAAGLVRIAAPRSLAIGLLILIGGFVGIGSLFAALCILRAAGRT